MTTSSSTSSTKIDPDELCQICQLTRENHGDAHHKFSTDGSLVPLDPPPKPRMDPPVLRGLTDRIKAKSFATLVEILAEKDILSGPEIVRIFTADIDDGPTYRG